jgi:hypothetical protein
VTSQFELISLLFHVHTGLLGRTKVVITHLSECKKMEELRDRVIKNYFQSKGPTDSAKVNGLKNGSQKQLD